MLREDFSMVSTRSMTKSALEQAESRSLKRVRVVEEQDSSILEEDIHEENDIYQQFDQAMIEKDWTTTKFHDRIFNTYIRRIFNCDKEHTDVLRQRIIASTHGIQVQDKKSRSVSNCGLCGNIRTLTKNLYIHETDETIECGRHCLDKLNMMVAFYLEVQSQKEGAERLRRDMVKQILTYWEHYMKYIQP